MDRWLALSTDATWLPLPLLMLLASEAAPAASLPSPLPLSLSPLRGVLGCSCWPALLLLPHLLVEYLGKWDSSLHPPHFISFPFYSASVSLSSARLPPPPFALCASVCFGSSELETAQASEIEKGASGHRPAHLKAEVDSLSLPPPASSAQAAQRVLLLRSALYCARGGVRRLHVSFRFLFHPTLIGSSTYNFCFSCNHSTRRRTFCYPLC